MIPQSIGLDGGERRLTVQHTQYGVGGFFDKIQQDKCRAVRLAVTPFPMSQCGDTDAERGGKLILRQACFLPDTFDVDGFRLKHSDRYCFSL